MLKPQSSTTSSLHLLLLMAQSCAPSSQLWNLFSFTYEGTQYVWALLASRRSRIDSTCKAQADTVYIWRTTPEGFTKFISVFFLFTPWPHSPGEGLRRGLLKGLHHYHIQQLLHDSP